MKLNTLIVAFMISLPAVSYAENETNITWTHKANNLFINTVDLFMPTVEVHRSISRFGTPELNEISKKYYLSDYDFFSNYFAEPGEKYSAFNDKKNQLALVVYKNLVKKKLKVNQDHLIEDSDFVDRTDDFIKDIKKIPGVIDAKKTIVGNLLQNTLGKLSRYKDITFNKVIITFDPETYEIVKNNIEYAY